MTKTIKALELQAKLLDMQICNASHKRDEKQRNYLLGYKQALEDITRMIKR